jgi:hypothetical protein
MSTLVTAAPPGRGLFGKALAVGFWGAGLSVTVAALAVPGLIVLLLLPLAGFWYLVFCVIAVAGDRR